MKHLKRYVNVAINKDYMDVQKYAFRKYKIKSVEGRHSHLSPEELHKLEDLQLGGKYAKLQKTKRFLFILLLRRITILRLYQFDICKYC